MSATGSTTEANKAIVKRIFDEVLSGGDFSVSDELVAPDCNFYTHARPEPFVGPQGFREYIGAVRTGMPDTKVDVHNMVAEGDTVVAFWTLNGTHTGTLLGIPALGNRIALDALEYVRLRDGKLIEIRLVMDTIGLMRQLGVLPGGAGPNLPLPLRAMVQVRRQIKKVRGQLK